MHTVLFSHEKRFRSSEFSPPSPSFQLTKALILPSRNSWIWHFTMRPGERWLDCWIKSEIVGWKGLEHQGPGTRCLIRWYRLTQSIQNPALKKIHMFLSTIKKSFPPRIQLHSQQKKNTISKLPMCVGHLPAQSPTPTARAPNRSRGTAHRRSRSSGREHPK